MKTKMFMVRFSPEEYQRAFRLARGRKKALAVIVRELIEGEIQKQERKAA